MPPASSRFVLIFLSDRQDPQFDFAEERQVFSEAGKRMGHDRLDLFAGAANEDEDDGGWIRAMNKTNTKMDSLRGKQEREIETSLFPPSRLR